MTLIAHECFTKRSRQIEFWWKQWLNYSTAAKISTTILTFWQIFRENTSQTILNELPKSSQFLANISWNCSTQNGSLSEQFFIQILAQLPHFFFLFNKTHLLDPWLSFKPHYFGANHFSSDLYWPHCSQPLCGWIFCEISRFLGDNSWHNERPRFFHQILALPMDDPIRLASIFLPGTSRMELETLLLTLDHSELIWSEIQCLKHDFNLLFSQKMFSLLSSFKVC